MRSPTFGRRQRASSAAAPYSRGMLSYFFSELGPIAVVIVIDDRNVRVSSGVRRDFEPSFARKTAA